MAINAQYLNGEYARKNPSFHTEDSPWKARQILKGIKRSELAPKTIAEVGCGAGEILVQLARHLPSATFSGYEYSPAGFAMCQEREAANIHYHNTDLPEGEHPFDLILCIDVFEHIEDHFAFLRRLSQRAEFFIFHIPLDMNVQMVARSKRIISMRKKVGHLHYFSKDTALATLEDCGFGILDFFYTPSGLDRPGSLAARILQIPRRVLQVLNQEMTARILGGYSLLVTAKRRNGKEAAGAGAAPSGG